MVGWHKQQQSWDYFPLNMRFWLNARPRRGELIRGGVGTSMCVVSYTSDALCLCVWRGQEKRLGRSLMMRIKGVLGCKARTRRYPDLHPRASRKDMHAEHGRHLTGTHM